MYKSMRGVDFLFLLFLSTTFINLSPCNGNLQVRCIESERQALLTFKKDLKDPSNRLSSWEGGNECCEWAGVVCDNSTGHVRELHLRGPDTQYDPWDEDDIGIRSKLGGAINPSLLNLKHLTYLDLSENYFQGLPIPSFIGSLVSLRYLNLSLSGFEGTIPHEFGNLSNLHSLALRGTFSYPVYKLNVENLHWLSRLSYLEHVDLSSVNLEKATNWLHVINMLPFLVELHLSNCQLGIFPPLQNVNFTSIVILDLSWNANFTSIVNSRMPSWIFSLSSLVSLDLSGNYLEGPLPDGPWNLTSLKTLDISRNSLHSPLPNWLFSLTSIVSLNLRGSGLDGPLPSGLLNMTGLRYLDISECYFNSTIPSWLYKFNHLETLILRYNSLQGTISSSVGNLTSLITLDLSDNKLEGRVPTQLGNLCNLRSLNLYVNKFEEEVSRLLKTLSGCISHSLENLQLSHMHLSGSLTDVLEQFGNLRILDVGDNSISGTIPESLGRMASLEVLNLAGNQLNGTLPESLGQLSNLIELRISNNHLEGVVSEVHFANLVGLRALLASGNRFVLNVSSNWIPPFQLNQVGLRTWCLGPKFPTWLFHSYRGMWSLDLSSTGISDEIPPWFWDLSSTISYLNLSHNQIRGEIPNLPKADNASAPMIYLGSNKFSGPLPLVSSNVRELDLSNNSFSRDLSHFLCDTRAKPNKLEILHLGENRLSGDIPDCWRNWQLLGVVKLGNNNLTGMIPSSMGMLRKLRSLLLRDNNLYGEVPLSLQNCTELVMFDLGENEFVGNIPKWIGKSLSNLMVLGFRSNNFTGSIPVELCNLTSLQILDMANNRLFGKIPGCFNKFKSMTIEQRSIQNISSFYGIGRISYSLYGGEFLETAFVWTKGREFQYSTILTFVISMDLSNNDLSGEIPEEITDLVGLLSLNLSRNNLSGTIPKKIGMMDSLISLDFSRNQLSGDIPPSMSSLNFLSYLNLSYNNLSGKIPSSTQLQSLDASSFIGNGLCGPPLTEHCDSDGATTNNGSEGDDEDSKAETYWFYLTIAFGFVVGFWCVWGPLLYNKLWRYAYFQFLENTWIKVYVLMRKLTRF